MGNWLTFTFSLTDPKRADNAGLLQAKRVATDFLYEAVVQWFNPVQQE